ncbi:uncharacterized protein TRAVEDRAFT_109407, partial [Trametes versicolor FP-101664 SS1]|uniref:uncharacterized protein n=1 Tax=Trametes versicolor (strain FP-101664) TaxID=717944 RepID=UPI0004622956
LRVADAPSLSSDERENIWNLWETNMRVLYAILEPSSFGWHPKSKRKELFHRNARFILVLDGEGSQAATTLVAFAMFRFERDEGEDLLYCYELQVSGLFRGSGIGHFFVEKLTAIGKRWGMSKIMLTALKSNVAAGRFYSKTGLVCLIYLPLGLTECLYRFQVDPSSPDYGPTSEDDDSPDEDAEDEPCDYEILSKTLE